MRKTITSITPLALERDSRTLKMAISVARLGYSSTVIEKFKSKADFSHLGISVISLSNQQVTFIQDIPIKQCFIKEKIVIIFKYFWHAAKRMRLEWFNDLISYYFFKKQFKKQYCLKTFKGCNADVYIFHSYEYTDFALHLPKYTKIVYDAHDFYQEIAPSTLESSLARNWILPFSKKLEKKMINRANIFSTVSEGLVHKYAKVFQRNPLVLYNTHDFRNDEKIVIDLRTFLNLKSNDVIVCSVGNKKLGMAFDELVDVFENRLTQIHLVFIGNGYDEIKSTYSNIHFVPLIDPNKLVPFIKSANFGIVPYFALTENYRYALPNRFFQMIAAEIPIIFSSELEEIVKLNNKFRFGIPMNIRCTEDIEKSVHMLMNNDSNYKAHAVTAAKMLNWESEEKKLKVLLEALCNN